MGQGRKPSWKVEEEVIISKFKKLAETKPNFNCKDAIEAHIWGSYICKQLKKSFNEIKTLAGLKINRCKHRPTSQEYIPKGIPKAKTQKRYCLRRDGKFLSRVYSKRSYERICPLCQNLNNAMSGGVGDVY